MKVALLLFFWLARLFHCPDCFAVPRILFPSMQGLTLIWQGFTSRFHCCVLSFIFLTVICYGSPWQIFVSSHPRLWKGVTHCWQTLPFQVQEPHILQSCSIWNWLAANGFIPFLNCTFGCTAILDILYLVILH